MKIINVSISATDVASAAKFYRETLLLPVEMTPSGAEITIGSSRLTLTEGDDFEGVHHLAFGILPSEFDMAHEWLSRRVPLLEDDGNDVHLGGDDWKSRSLYFLGPEGIILEFIAREADSSKVPGSGEKPYMVSISEVGIGVENVPEAVSMLSKELSVPHFYDLSETFASMGGHDGLIIVVQKDRLWFPNKISQAARGPLTIQVESVDGKASLELGPTISVFS